MTIQKNIVDSWRYRKFRYNSIKRSIITCLLRIKCWILGHNKKDSLWEAGKERLSEGTNIFSQTFNQNDNELFCFDCGKLLEFRIYSDHDRFIASKSPLKSEYKKEFYEKYKVTEELFKYYQKISYIDKRVYEK